MLLLSDFSLLKNFDLIFWKQTFKMDLKDISEIFFIGQYKYNFLIFEFYHGHPFGFRSVFLFERFFFLRLFKLEFKNAFLIC